MQKTSTVITFSNFKGGTGKTTNCIMTAFELSKLGYKVLVIDKDPQANSTTFLYRTYEEIQKKAVEHETFLLDGLRAGSFKDCILNIKENLDLIPTTPRFAFYQKELNLFCKHEEHQIGYFKAVLKEVKDNYDFVFIDVPPTVSIYTDAALYASNYSLIILQTQEPSLQGAQVFVEYIQNLVDTHRINLDVIGILPVILKSNSQMEIATLENARNIFGEEHLFNTHIKTMERLKRYYMTGITNLDHHDKNVQDVYRKVAIELLQRLGVEVYEKSN